MTQISVRTVATDITSLSPTVPRPRESWERSAAARLGLRVAPPLTSPLAPQPAPQLASPTALQPPRVDSPVTPRTPTRVRRGVRLRTVAVDAALALTLAATEVAVGGLSLRTALAGAVLWPLLLLGAGHYQQHALGESRTRRMRAVLSTGLRGSVLALAASPWFDTVDLIALARLVAGFAVVSALHHLVVARSRPRLVLAGRRRDVRDAMLALGAAGHHDVVAVCLTRTAKTSFGEVPTYVGVDAAADAADRHEADALVVLPGARVTPQEMRRLHWALAGVGTELCVGTGLLDVTPDRTRVFGSGGLNLVHVAPASLRGPRRWAKEVLDRLAAAAGLLVLLPVLAAVALVVRLDSPGPALYRQARVGKDGRMFTMFKFRSMACSAELEVVGLAGRNEADGALFKIRQDPRVTRTGRWMRRYSVDEIPQLWNVVRGDMSLVGPRPALPEEVARYDVDPRRRLVVKPGLTGLWQVSGRSDLTWEQTVRLDVAYVDNWSFGRDLAILRRTVGAVLGHRGAY